MGKRSNFQRVERDFYPTPYEAVLPLLPHLPEGATFIEPCAGNGALVDHLQDHGYKCLWAGDLVPLRRDIRMCDALTNIPVALHHKMADLIITNPPWNRDFLHPMIEVCVESKTPTWLLFDADWMHTKQSADLIKSCVKIVSVGRVKWIPDSKMTGKDNCCWYLFDPNHTGPTEFYGR